MALPHIEMPSFGLIPVMPSSYPRALPHRKMLQIFFFLLWPRSLHVWLWEKERKFTEEEQEEELLKISNLRPSPVSRNLPRDDDDDAKSLLEPTYLRPSPVNRNLPRDDDDDDAKSLL